MLTKFDWDQICKTASHMFNQITERPIPVVSFDDSSTSVSSFFAPGMLSKATVGYEAPGFSGVFES